MIDKGTSVEISIPWNCAHPPRESENNPAFFDLFLPHDVEISPFEQCTINLELGIKTPVCSAVVTIHIPNYKTNHLFLVPEIHGEELF